MLQVTSKDKEIEHQTLAAVSKQWNIVIVPTVSDVEKFDGYTEDAIFEVKRRHVTSRRYKTIILSNAKFKFLQAYDCLQAFFVVVFDDGIWTVDTKTLGQLNTRWGGRKDRGLKNDRELVVDIPIGAFVRLE